MTLPEPVPPTSGRGRARAAGRSGPRVPGRTGRGWRAPAGSRQGGGRRRTDSACRDMRGSSTATSRPSSTAISTPPGSPHKPSSVRLPSASRSTACCQAACSTSTRGRSGVTRSAIENVRQSQRKLIVTIDAVKSLCRTSARSRRWNATPSNAFAIEDSDLCRQQLAQVTIKLTDRAWVGAEQCEMPINRLDRPELGIGNEPPFGLTISRRKEHVR